MEGTGQEARPRRRGIHPFGACVASVLGVALGVSVAFLPVAAGATSSASAPVADLLSVAPPAHSLAVSTTTTSTPGPPRKPTTTTVAPKAPPTTAKTGTTLPSSSPRQAAAVTTTAPAGKYAFLSIDQGRPVRYDPCQSIHYTVNLAKAPANALDDLKEAVRRVTVATGLSFVYDGETDEIPTTNRELHGANVLTTGWPPVVIAWAEPSDTDLLTDGSVGEGGSTWSGFPGHQVYVTGLVVVDATQNNKLAAGFGGHSLGAVLMHELGHLVGLDHVEDKTQMMYPTITEKPAKFAAGDLAGLRQLGAESGCFAG